MIEFKTVTCYSKRKSNTQRLKLRINPILLFIILMMSLFNSCAEYTTEIAGIDDFKIDNQLSVVGYLSNYGAVVNLQKALSPLDTINETTMVNNATVQLINPNNNEVIIELQQKSEYIFITPETFVPALNTDYYLKVVAPDFPTVISAMQKVEESPAINLVEMKIEEYREIEADTNLYYLFGIPRHITLSYFIDNSEDKISYGFSNFLYRYKSKLYERVNGGYIEHDMPHFYFNIGVGVNDLILENELVKGILYNAYDQIQTNETIDTLGETYQIIDQIESIIIQPISFSSDFVDFFESTNFYSANKSDPFSVLNEKTVSNMSNGIGFWGSVFIAEKEIEIPENNDES